MEYRKKQLQNPKHEALNNIKIQISNVLNVGVLFWILNIGKFEFV